VEFEWDEKKQRMNVRNHGLDFSLAAFVANDPLRVEVYDRFENGEHRYHLVGVVHATCLVLVHSYPDPDNENLIRVISLRKATPHERRRYEEGIYSTHGPGGPY
jgi:uncharacterized DUF497 family protein